MITEQQKSKLQAQGYQVENMGEAWGAEFEGQYRWINDTQDGDGFGVVQYSEETAWLDALQFQSSL